MLNRATTIRYFEEIEASEGDILDAFKDTFLPGTAMNYQQFYLAGIGRRALAQSRAFRALIADNNSLMCAATLRLQLDTVLRLYALYWVEDPEHFATQVFSGISVSKLRAADGQPMLDAYLKKRLKPANPWVERVYKETSGYVHFSDKHIRSSVEQIEGVKVTLHIGPQDRNKGIEYYGELIEAFRHVNLMIPVAVSGWLERMRLQTKGVELNS